MSVARKIKGSVIGSRLLDLHELCHCSGSFKRLRTNDIAFAWGAARAKVLPQ